MMSFGSPPPLFRQGISHRAKYVFYVVLSLVFILVDGRFNALDVFRSTISGIITPVVELVEAPVKLFNNGRGYFESKRSMKKEIDRLTEENQALVLKSARFEELLKENERLRELVNAVKGISSRTATSEVIGRVADPFSQRIQINIGSNEGVAAGMPVIGVFGVLGQVSRTVAKTSEVRLLFDHTMKISVVNERTQEKFILAGTGDELLEVMFVRPESDIRPGDKLLTSGLDQIFPRYIPTAEIASVEYRNGDKYKRVIAVPNVKIDDVQFATVILSDPNPQAFENNNGSQSSRRRQR